MPADASMPENHLLIINIASKIRYSKVSLKTVDISLNHQKPTIIASCKRRLVVHSFHTRILFSKEVSQDIMVFKGAHEIL